MDVDSSVVSTRQVDVVPLHGTVRATAVTVGTTATALPATPLSGRYAVSIVNNSTSTVYLGGSDVTAASGYALYKYDSMDIDLDDETIIYAIVSAGTADVRVLEVSSYALGAE